MTLRRRHLVLLWVAAIAAHVAWFSACFAPKAHAHEIYLGLHGRNGQLCCGGDDCAVTLYRERGGAYEFLTREKDWVAIPEDRITFLPIPGDPPHDDSHTAHLCYRIATDSDRTGYGKSSVFGAIFLYCAFIPPGGV